MHLTDCFMETFAFTTHFVGSVAGRQPLFEAVKETVDRLMTKGDSAAVQAGISRDDYDLARFAVCAWIDESIARSPWQQKQLWLRGQLQRRHFNTTTAGEEFFQKLEGLGLQQREVREVYYLCLALGFTGRYCKPGDEHQLEELKKSQMKLLVGNAAGLPPLECGTIFPEAYPFPETSELPSPRKPLPVSLSNVLCLGAPVLAFSLLFVLYRFILSAVGDNLLKAVAD